MLRFESDAEIEIRRRCCSALFGRAVGRSVTRVLGNQLVGTNEWDQKAALYSERKLLGFGGGGVSGGRFLIWLLLGKQDSFANEEAVCEEKGTGDLVAISVNPFLKGYFAGAIIGPGNLGFGGEEPALGGAGGGALCGAAHGGTCAR